MSKVFDIYNPERDECAEVSQRADGQWFGRYDYVGRYGKAQSKWAKIQAPQFSTIYDPNDRATVVIDGRTFYGDVKECGAGYKVRLPKN